MASGRTIDAASIRAHPRHFPAVGQSYTGVGRLVWHSSQYLASSGIKGFMLTEKPLVCFTLSHLLVICAQYDTYGRHYINIVQLLTVIGCK